MKPTSHTETEEEHLSLCNGCHCMTKSIRKGRANFRCGKCGYNKTLGDFYQWELKKRLKNEK